VPSEITLITDSIDEWVDSVTGRTLREYGEIITTRVQRLDELRKTIVTMTVLYHFQDDCGHDWWEPRVVIKEFGFDGFSSTGHPTNLLPICVPSRPPSVDPVYPGKSGKSGTSLTKDPYWPQSVGEPPDRLNMSRKSSSDEGDPGAPLSFQMFVSANTDYAREQGHTRGRKSESELQRLYPEGIKYTWSRGKKRKVPLGNLGSFEYITVIITRTPTRVAKQPMSDESDYTSNSFDQFIKDWGYDPIYGDYKSSEEESDDPGTWEGMRDSLH
jgi:hypothetical protein